MKKFTKRAFITLIVINAIFVAWYFGTNKTIISRSYTDIEFSPGADPAGITGPDSAAKPKNIIVFIADGFGFPHMSLAMLSKTAEGTSSLWRAFPVRAWHDARSYYGPLTDSGASGTALATGSESQFGMVGTDPKGNPVNSLFDYAWESNYATGVVTDSYIWDATPASFVVSNESRDNAEDILKQIAASELDLIFGELEDVGEDEVPEYEPTLEILRQRYYLLDETLSTAAAGDQPIAAIYDEDEVQDLSSSPNLLQLTELALSHIQTKNKPFVLFVESEEMDAASHANDSKRVMNGLESIQATVSFLLDFAKEDGETLLVFTSDHDTGGPAIVNEPGNYPNMEIVWPSADHTATVVPLLAYGPGSDQFLQVYRNWQVGKLLISMVND